MRHLFLALAAISSWSMGNAQGQQIQMLRSETPVSFHSLQSRSTFGQIGVSFARQCKLQGSSDVYLVGNELYAATPADCVTIVLNTSRPEGSDPAPNWLNIQVTRYFDAYDNRAVTLARSGTFNRGGKALAALPDKGVPIKGVSLEDFDALHGPAKPPRQVEESDALFGLPWHGSPDGNDAAETWADRDQLPMTAEFRSRLKQPASSLNTRLIRFTPGDKSGPMTIGQINRNGASVMVVKVFSPYSTDIGGTFGLVFETDPSRLAALVADAKIPEPSCTGLSCLWAWLFPSRAQ